MLYFLGKSGSDCRSESIRFAVPEGVLVPASHASTVLIETPITAAKMPCVISNRTLAPPSNSREPLYIRKIKKACYTTIFSISLISFTI